MSRTRPGSAAVPNAAAARATLGGVGTAGQETPARPGPPGPAEGQSFHGWLTSLDGYEGQVAGLGFYPPRGAETVAYDGRFAPLLSRLGLSPYTHQAEAFALLEGGVNPVVATPTASGKSLCYQLPILEAVAGGGTALYLAPTKALARDQLGKLTDLQARAGAAGEVRTFDGDTPASERRSARAAGCILTNPDMLHYGILPYHHLWAGFLGRLRYLVLDELHSYRGVLGTHVANILRRLLRVARHYGAEPQVIAASATIGNPARHAENLTGLPVRTVTTDGAPQGAREFIFWRPPLLPGRDGRRRSPNTEAAWLAAQFARSGVRSIFFCNSRKSAELLRRYATDQLPPEDAPLLQSYRAGYTAEDRRWLEEGFRKGDIMVLTATSALELGIDVGAVDAVVMVGWPGSHMALWQRAGRAGRAGRRSLALLIPGNDPLDEYYLQHPELVTEGRVEDAVADPFNSEIHPLHLACAAAELPLRAGEELIAPWCDLRATPGLARSGERWVAARRRPHRRLAVRGSLGRRVTLVDGFGRVIGESDEGSALRDLHPGAVYLHQGETYLVGQLDLEGGRALLLPHIEEFYTQARSETDVEVLGEEGRFGRARVVRVRVSHQVTGYVMKRYLTEAVLDERLLDLPEVSYPTQALCFSAADVAQAVPAPLLPGALHALEHAMIGLLPAFVLCERADVGGVSYPHYPATGEPLVFIYDGYPGGVGYARAGAERFSEWLRATRELLGRCACEGGCPRCVLSPKCGNGNQVLDKRAAYALAGALLDTC